MKPCYLFVRGTLHSDHDAGRVQLIEQHFTLAGHGSVQGRLFEVAGSPWLALSTGPDDAVPGELYQLAGSTAVLDMLDQYEGCIASNPTPHEHRRREVPVKLGEGGTVLAWAYLYNWPLQGRKPLCDGNYAAGCSVNGAIG